jgi:hypothetical protein
MELDKALSDIEKIRSQIAKNQEFRGLGPHALAFTAFVAIAAGTLQNTFIPDAAKEPERFVALWVIAAFGAALIVGIEAVRRSRVEHGGLADEMLHTAAAHFLPAGVAGALITIIMQQAAPEALWMLPGLWQILYALGVFAACASLNRAMYVVGFWYFFTGLACLMLGRDTNAFSALSMALPFAIGQTLAAYILYRTYKNAGANA